MSVGLRLWPRPRVERWEGGVLPPVPTLPLPASLPELARRVLEPAFARGAAGTRLLFAYRPGAVPRQGYRLTLDREIVLEAGDEAGALHGAHTLAQIAATAPVDGWPAGHLEDHPDLAERGFMLDISRCQVPRRETLCGLIDLLARLKYNQLQLYTEHTFAFPGHEVVWGDASPLSPGDVRELDLYARQRGIELVPNLNCFGHFERWLRHPEYHHLAECPEGFTGPDGRRRPHGSTLHPGPASLRFLDGLHDAFLPCFSSRSFNLGGDEPWELGRGRSRARCQARGREAVYVDFLRALHRRVAARGFRAQFWADIVLRHPGQIRRLPPGLTALIWGYEADHPFADQVPRFGAAGLASIVCPGTSGWRSLVGRTENALANIASAAAAGRVGGARGLLLTHWGDGGHHQPWPVLLPGLFWAAAQAWHAKGADPAELPAAIDRWGRVPLPGAVISSDVRLPVGTGAALMAAGRLADPIRRRPRNAGAFHQLLFDEFPLPGRDPEPAVTAAELRRASGAIENLDHTVAALAPAPERDEVRLGLALAAAGCRRGLLARGAGVKVAEAQRRELTATLGRFEEAWLARHRPGGLHESSARLRGALAAAATGAGGRKLPR